ncbi:MULTISPECIES: ImcF-related family protein [unclassified Pseudomonas]|uniref:ImcF-related family protein n=1 Tax=unclassified Pseudomonas TaxID=196821 RepID=UPI0011ADAB08|nr:MULTISPECIES: ImcF-related family protein [unclassified Pseudomonas]TWC06647.1 ImcF (intracellular multiplication and macrophage-killing)-related protein [Pseudomonas sp. SJZ075]TWC26629.1 ImcF (intracellular multiplication and macrophage-killing)-related protein [Pseudomonas sp. SJZ078]TWC45364.1 ImcF (intracellular multiplication and macrophage-killing)-related protein [Pseudomonas sp. SJZ124]TWC80445.1 ImcF (intracellular multiplication and macrophage-killing)-related protein [Pseudomonas
MLRALKTMLRASPLLLGLLLTMYLIIGHGHRLAVDGHAPLAGLGSRWLLIGLIALLVLLVYWLRRRADKITAPKPIDNTVPSEEGFARGLALRERLHAWRQREGRKLPGFLLIGPAGVDKGPLLGLPGGTEYDLRCSAVGGFSLYDISGSLLNQRQPEDARLWRLLLDELQQTAVGERQPRGVVLVLSAEQLLCASAAEGDLLALTLHTRLEELARRFGNALAVQVIISGCEQLPGYSASLAWMAADQRELSIEFPPATRNRHLLASLGQRMSGLISGLESGQYERLQREPDVQVRGTLYGFSPMWRVFSATLQGFLETAFGQERGVAQVALQSLRFSAQPATVEVTAPALLRALQACRRSGRLRTPLRQTMAWWRPRAHYLVLAVSLLISLLLLNLYRDQSRRLERVDRHIDALQQGTGPVNPGVLSVGALLRLDRLADVEQLIDQWWLPWAVDRQLHSRTTQLYDQGLQQLLLPDVLQRLNNSLRAPSSADEASLRQSLGLYLMLGGEGRFDAQVLREWYGQTLRKHAGSALSDAQYWRLDGHLQRLLKHLAQVAPLSLDRVLIEQAREQLAAQPLAQRLYRQLFEQLSRHSLADFSIVSALGAQGLLLFDRRSGEPSSRGVPGAFSAVGEQQLRHLLDPWLAAELEQEYRLMGWDRALEAAPLKQEILALYHSAYIDHWQGFFDDLQLVGLDQVEHVPRRLLQLAQDDSPILGLMQAAARETNLQRPHCLRGGCALHNSEARAYSSGWG